MTQWNWLTKPQVPYTWGFLIRVVAKGLVLFVIVNVVFALLNPIPVLGKLSLYNVVIPGRARLPYGENPEASYNTSLTDLNTMFNSHEIAGAKKTSDEFRVIIVGDSSVWGVLLDADQTLSAYINAQHLTLANGKHVRAYNLGYPDQTLTKDIMILQQALKYQPDLVVWPVTLEAMARGDQQLGSLLVRENPDRINSLVSNYQLTSVDPKSSLINKRSLVKSTLFGQRRLLADMLRNQMYGITSAITGIDQRYPRFYQPRRENFDTDVTWHGLSPQTLTEENLAFDVLDAGLKMSAPTPMIIVNEPIFISRGVNSSLRYNFFYPRWIYDAYRTLISDHVQKLGVKYGDFWDLVPADLFTDSAVHMQPTGSQHFAQEVGKMIVESAGG